MIVSQKNVHRVSDCRKNVTVPRKGGKTVEFLISRLSLNLDIGVGVGVGDAEPEKNKSIVMRIC